MRVAQAQSSLRVESFSGVGGHSGEFGSGHLLGPVVRSPWRPILSITRLASPTARPISTYTIRTGDALLCGFRDSDGAHKALCLWDIDSGNEWIVHPRRAGGDGATPGRGDAFYVTHRLAERDRAQRHPTATVRWLRHALCDVLTRARPCSSTSVATKIRGQPGWGWENDSWQPPRRKSGPAGTPRNVCFPPSGTSSALSPES